MVAGAGLGRGADAVVTREARLGMAGQAAVYLFGLWLYGYVLAWGRSAFYSYDWPLAINGLEVLKQGWTRGVMPFHAYFFPEDVMAAPFAQQTEFFARAHAILAPHVVGLLPFLSTRAVVVLHVLFMYTLGFLGLVKLARQNRFDALGVAALCALFLLGGFISTKLVAGNLYDAAAYFLLPYVLVYGQRLLGMRAGALDRAALARSVVGLSLTLVYTVLVGSIHVAFIELLALGAMLAWARRTRWALAAVLALLAWGGAVRFVPMAAFNQAYLGEQRRTVAWGGYGSWWGEEKPCSVRSPTCWLSDLADAMAVLHPVRYHGDQNWWEFSLYISLAGVALLVAGWAFLAVKGREALLLIGRRDYRRAASAQAILGWTGLLLFALSMGPVYGRLLNPLFTWLHLPHVNTIPSRMIVFPFLLFACYAVAGWHVARRGQGRRPWLVAAAQATLVAVMMAASLEHAAHWNMGSIEASGAVTEQTAWYALYSPSRQPGLMNLPVSPAYRLTVYASIAATLAYLVTAVGWLAWGRWGRVAR
jgi:hypothetical protein